jgi:hypothetical protein
VHILPQKLWDSAPTWREIFMRQEESSRWRAKFLTFHESTWETVHMLHWEWWSQGRCDNSRGETT